MKGGSPLHRQTPTIHSTICRCDDNNDDDTADGDSRCQGKMTMKTYKSDQMAKLMTACRVVEMRVAVMVVVAIIIRMMMIITNG